eukprot:10917458-Alexandrium_andersonii.AAC.1
MITPLVRQESGGGGGRPLEHHGNGSKQVEAAAKLLLVSLTHILVEAVHFGPHPGPPHTPGRPTA